MSCRTSSRNCLNETPSASSRWRSAGIVMLLASAMRAIAALTVASSTRTPDLARHLQLRPIDDHALEHLTFEDVG